MLRTDNSQSKVPHSRIPSVEVYVPPRPVGSKCTYCNCDYCHRIDIDRLIILAALKTEHSLRKLCHDTSYGGFEAFVHRDELAHRHIVSLFEPERMAHWSGLPQHVAKRPDTEVSFIQALYADRNIPLLQVIAYEQPDGTMLKRYASAMLHEHGHNPHPGLDDLAMAAFCDDKDTRIRATELLQRARERQEIAT